MSPEFLLCAGIGFLFGGMVTLIIDDGDGFFGGFFFTVLGLGLMFLSTVAEEEPAAPETSATAEVTTQADEIAQVEEKYGITLVGDDLTAQFPDESGEIGFIEFVTVDPETGVVSGPVEGSLFNKDDEDFILTVTDEAGVAVEYKQPAPAS